MFKSGVHTMLKMYVKSYYLKRKTVLTEELNLLKKKIIDSFIFFMLQLEYSENHTFVHVTICTLQKNNSYYFAIY